MACYRTCLTLLIFSGSFALAQDRHVIYFKDKAGTGFSVTSPNLFLSDRAIARRTTQGIAITEADLPVTAQYLNQLRAAGAKVRYSSRWLNCALIETDQATLTTIKALSFVSKSELAAPGTKVSGGRTKAFKNKKGPGIAPATMTQLQMVGIDSMHMEGIRGEGVVVAVLDAGFPGVDTADPFKSLFLSERITMVHDFVNGTANIYRYDDHGTSVLSVIAAHGTNYTGGAYEATFELFVTEDVDSEYRIEEYNWLFAAERADSSGADIIHSSLGYNTFDDVSMDYGKNQLDGSTAIVSKAAAAAIARGIVVVVSAGNEGNNGWGLVTPPADVNGILAVGSVTSSGNKSLFSSFGPASDGRIKPDVVAMGSGTVVVRPTGVNTTESGTSLAAPIVTSLVAGVRQRYPDLTVAEIYEAITSTASQASHPDNLLGYGIPDYARIKKELLAYQPSEPISIFPNPMDNGKFRVLLEQEGQDAEIMVYDLRGTVLARYMINFTWRNNPIEMDLSSLPAGTYLVKVKTKDNFKTARLVKT